MYDPIFIADLFTIAKYGSNPRAHPQKNGLKSCGTYI